MADWGSYLKDKKIELWRVDSSETDKDCFPLVKETKLATLWAYYRHSSAREYYAAMAVQEEYQALFVINYRKDINPRSDYIMFRGKRYDIISVDDYQGYKGDIRIIAKLNR